MKGVKGTGKGDNTVVRKSTITKAVRKVALNPPAKPTKRWGPERLRKQAAIVRAIEEGAKSLQEACRRANCSRTTFYEWIKTDPDFLQAVIDAPVVAVATMEDRLFANGLKGDQRAIEFYLCNRASDRWKKTLRVDHGNADGNPLKIDMTSRQIVVRDVVKARKDAAAGSKR